MKKHYKTRFFNTARALGLALVLASPMAAYAEQTVFNISQQPLKTAIAAFAEQAKVNLIAEGDVDTSVLVSAVNGEMNTGAALRQLLNGTDLKVHQRSDGMFIIARGKGAESGSEADKRLLDSRKNHVLEEITVTAQKREQNLHDVPISITAMGAEELANKGIDNFDDLKFAAPGIGVRDEGPGRQSVFLRGIANLLGNEPLAGIYIDDAPGDTGGGTGSIAVVSQTFPLQFTDLARVEVLHGPQGTLYGAGAVGGTIRYITKDPVLDHFGAKGDVTLSFTKDGDPSQRATAVVNLPVVEGEFGIRIASTFGNSGGFIDMPVLDRKDVNNQDMQQVRVKALWQPSERFDARATVIVHKNESDVGIDIADEDLNLVIQPSEMFVEGLPFHDKAEHYNLALNYDAGFARLLSSSTYMNRDMHSFGWVRAVDSDRTFLPGATHFGDVDALNEVFSQEIRATSADAASLLSWTVGGFYRDRTGKSANGRSIFTFNGGTFPSDLPGVNSELKTRSWAAFADAGYKFVDRLELGAGIRYFEDERDFAVFTTGQRDSVNFDATTWRVYASYDVTDTVKVYTNVGTGFRSGGNNLSTLAVLPGFGPETLTSYDLGAKMSLLDGRLNADIAFFYSEYEDMLHRDFLLLDVGLVNIIGNAGTAEVKGIDARLDWQVTDRLSLYFNGAITDDEITEVSDGVAAVIVGDPLNYSPEYTFSVGAEHQFDWSTNVPGFVRVDYNQRGESTEVARTSSPFILTSDVLGFLNMRIGAQWNGWTFELFGNNLSNENGSDSVPDWGVTPRPRPRTMGIRASVDFLN